MSTTNDTQPVRRCACKDWNAHECYALRHGTASGYDPDEEDLWRSLGEACECPCHDDEFRDWCEDEDG